MGIFSKIIGTISNKFQLNKTAGPILKDASGVLQVRNFNDTTLEKIEFADPTTAQHGVTKLFFETNGNNIIAVPTQATLEHFKTTVNPIFVDADEITIDKVDNVEAIALAGSPCRYSTDEINWRYGYIEQVTVNAGDIGMVIAGVSLVSEAFIYFQIGSPEQIIIKEFFIDGTQSTGDGKKGVVNKRRHFWDHARSYAIKIFGQLDTAGVSSAHQFVLAKGTVNDDINTSVVDLGAASARVGTTTNISPTNQLLVKGDELFPNNNQINTTPGSDLLITLLACVNGFNYQEFVPLFPPDLPYAHTMGGTTLLTGGTLMSTIDLVPLSDQSATITDMGDQSITRPCSSCCFGPDYSFGIGGFTNNTLATSSNVIDFVNNTDSISSASDRGDTVVAKGRATGASGALYGYLIAGCTGLAASTGTNSIDYMDILVSTGNSLDSGDTLTAMRDQATCYNIDSAFPGGGAVTGGTKSSVITRMTTSNAIEGSSDSGDLTVASNALMSVSWVAGDQGFYAGGANAASVTITTIESIDTSLTLVGACTDRADLPVAKAFGGGISSETFGDIPGGTSVGAFTSGVLSSVDSFDFTAGTIVMEDLRDLTESRGLMGCSP